MSEEIVDFVEAPVETDTAAPPPPEPPETPPAPPAEPPIPKGVQKRIDRAVRQKYEAEAEAKHLRERVAFFESQRAPEQKADGEPTIEQFDNFDKFVAAKAGWIAKQQIESTLTEREQRQAAARESTERTKTVEQWNKRVEEATAELPDFEEVVASSDVPMTPPMQQAIMESDVGPKLAYYLANNPDEARNIAAMSPIGAIRSLGRIEERLSKPSAVTTTSAPPPVKPVGARSTVAKDPGKMSDAEYAKWRKTAKTS